MEIDAYPAIALRLATVVGDAGSAPERLLAQGSGPVSSSALTIVVFGLFVLVTLAVVIQVGRTNRTAADYYTGGWAFTGSQNGLAIAGDYLSAASFLGIAGLIAVAGYDGVMLAVGALVTWVMALLLIAEMLRNTGRFTMGDVVAFRMRQRPLRAAAATSTMVVSSFYLLAQMVGAGGLIALLLGIPNSDRFGQAVVLAGAGGLMIAYVLVGGMKGTTWVQIMKGVLLLVGTAFLATWVLGYFHYDPASLLGSATEGSAVGEQMLAPGLQYGQSALSKLDFISLSVALVLGTPSLPHILMRFYTVPNAGEARRSVVWAIWTIGVFYLLLIVVGFGAAALVGPEAIKAAPGGSNSAAPLLAYRAGGELLLAIVAAIAFATILAVVAGLTITASATFAHDVYANVLKRGHADPGSEIRVARRTALGVGIFAIIGGILANGQNVAILVGLAFAVAASANLPTILYSLFWKRFNTTGALFSIYGGMTLSIGLIIFGPGVSGSPAAMIKGVDFAWFPLANPGLVSIPASFLLGAIGTMIGSDGRHAGRRFAEMEVRALTGAGAADDHHSPEAAVRPPTSSSPPDVGWSSADDLGARPQPVLRNDP